MVIWMPCGQVLGVTDASLIPWTPAPSHITVRALHSLPPESVGLTSRHAPWSTELGSYPRTPQNYTTKPCKVECG
jgi:hypothetical protein